MTAHAAKSARFLVFASELAGASLSLLAEDERRLRTILRIDPCYREFLPAVSR